MGIVIELENVTKVYNNGKVVVEALRGVSLKILTGEFVAIVGASGSGKSTLMNILGCLDRPTAGRYLLDGREVSHMDRDELAEVRNQVLGFVFQSFNLLARTSARAIATRCCCPPESWFGRWSSRSPSPTRPSASAARRRRSRVETPE